MAFPTPPRFSSPLLLFTSRIVVRRCGLLRDRERSEALAKRNGRSAHAGRTATRAGSLPGRFLHGSKPAYNRTPPLVVPCFSTVSPYPAPPSCGSSGVSLCPSSRTDRWRVCLVVSPCETSKSVVRLKSHYSEMQSTACVSSVEDERQPNGERVPERELTSRDALNQDCACGLL